MKNAVIPRHTDELGRIPIPIDFRKTLSIAADLDTPVYLSEPNDRGIVTISLEPQGIRTIIQAGFGFLVLPQTYRYQYGLVECTVDFWMESGKLKMKKVIPHCILSGNTADLIRYKDTDKYISKQVITELYKSVQ